MLLTSPKDFTFAASLETPKLGKKIHDGQGPHWSPAVRVYANPIAKAAIDNNKATFPPGSILVKEKLMKNKLEAITAMIREQDCYDRSDDKNNWRYFYVDESAEMQFGRIESCRKCHKNAAETDFAFPPVSKTSW